MSNTGDWRDQRRDYQGQQLDDGQLLNNPLQQFQHWMDAALQSNIADATACTLATSSRDGRVSARIVLLKHADETGFCWYTNYLSRKGQELADNPQACLLFYWPSLHRQVRIEGQVRQLPGSDADDYFQTRPRESQISAASSQQSAPIADRQSLESKAAAIREQYSQDSIPRPLNWGGYCLQPHYYEFWQGRENRLHDRFAYRLQTDTWVISRLQP